MQWAVDGAVVSADRDLLTVLGLGFMLLAVIHVALSVLRSWAVLYLSTTLNLQWLANVFSHLLRLPVSYFEKRHLGDVVSRFGAVTNIQRTLTSSFDEALIDIFALQDKITSQIAGALAIGVTQIEQRRVVDQQIDAEIGNHRHEESGREEGQFRCAIDDEFGIDLEPKLAGLAKFAAAWAGDALAGLVAGAVAGLLRFSGAE